MRKFVLICLLFLFTVVFGETDGYRVNSFYGKHNSSTADVFFIGYAQGLNGNAPTIDLNLITISFFPFDFYDMEIGMDFLHFQISTVGRIQRVSDEALWCLISYLPYVVPFSIGFAGGPPILLDIVYTLFMGVNYAWHSSLYFPVLPQRWLGIVNKHRFVTEIITKGWHKKSITFQDDLGLRLEFILKKTESACDSPQCKGVTRYDKLFIDTGVRFEKNFDRDWKSKLFLQTGYRIL